MINARLTCRSCLLIVFITTVCAGYTGRSQKSERELEPAIGNKQTSDGMNSTAPINGNVVAKDDNHSAESCQSPMQEFVSPVHGRPRCCRKCEAGTGMLRLCTDTKETLCWPCEARLEFAPTASATAKCLRCRRCGELHPLATIRRPCTPTSNTVCECPAGYFMSLENQTCKPCSVCRPGEAVFKPCEWDSDTQCQVCPGGFWSARSLDSVKCIPCQSCPTDHVVVRECSGDSNTLCCPRSNPNCTAKELSFYGGFLSYRNDATEEYGSRVKHTQMLPIYCSFMGLIIVCLILYVIYKLWKQRNSVAKTKLTDIFSIEENRCGSANKFSHGHPGDSHLSGDFQQRSNTGSSSGSSSSSGHRSGRSDLGHRERMGHHESSREENKQLLGTGQLPSSGRYYEMESVSSLPIPTLGVLCYQLSMKGWQQVAAAFGISEHSLELPWKDASGDTFYSSLIRAAMSAKSAALSHAGHDSTRSQDGDLLWSVRVIDELCNRPNSVTVMAFSAALRQADRCDLLRIISVENQHLTAKDEFAKAGAMSVTS